jgi:hypothetical protein
VKIWSWAMTGPVVNILSEAMQDYRIKHVCRRPCGMEENAPAVVLIIYSLDRYLPGVSLLRH